MSAGRPGRFSRWRDGRKDERCATCRLSPSLPHEANSSMVQQVPFRPSFSKPQHGDTGARRSTEKLPLLKFEPRGESILAQSFADYVVLFFSTPTGCDQWFSLSVPPCLRGG